MNECKKRPNRIAIAGEGPAGLLAARALAQKDPKADIVIFAPANQTPHSLPITTINAVNILGNNHDDLPHADEIQVGTGIFAEPSRRFSRRLFHNWPINNGLYAPRLDKLRQELKEEIAREYPNVQFRPGRLTGYEIKPNGIAVRIDDNIEDFDFLIGATGIGAMAKLGVEQRLIKEITRRRDGKTLGLYVNLPDDIKQLLPNLDNTFYYANINLNTNGDKARIYITPATDGTFLILLGGKRQAIDELLKIAREQNDSDTPLVLKAIQLATQNSNFREFTSRISAKNVDETRAYNLNHVTTRIVTNKLAKERIVMLGDERMKINPAWGLGLIFAIRAVSKFIKFYEKYKGDLTKVGKRYNSLANNLSLRFLTHTMDIISSLVTKGANLLGRFIEI